jgi:putative ABC transport system substrate-binding protein
MNRRDLCRALAAGSVLGACGARAQPRAAKVAVVSIDRPSPDNPAVANFRRGMRDRGYVEGRNLVVDTWWGEGSAERLTALVPQIVASRPDVVVALSGLVVRPLQAAGVALPVVFTYSGEPVLGKVVASYARPGGNYTGIALFMIELVPKRVEILREMLPSVRRLGIVGWSRHAGEPLEVKASLEAAKRAGVEARYHPADNLADIEAAYVAMAAWRADAALAFADGVTVSNAARIAALSRQHRIPTIGGWAVFAQQGNLMTYGPNLEETYAHLAVFVDRILRGAKPADIPVERPTVHEFAINLATARDFRIVVPPAVLARASVLID